MQTNLHALDYFKPIINIISFQEIQNKLRIFEYIHILQNFAVNKISNSINNKLHFLISIFIKLYKIHNLFWLENNIM